VLSLAYALISVANGLAFISQKEVAKLTAEWPVGRFVDIWNGFAGVAPFGELKPVKKFTDRKVAVARICKRSSA
jgi:hypothetical protein